VSLRFGTDGVRGPAQELTDPLVAALGRAAVAVLGPHRYVIGRDTRRSGPRLEAALADGLVAAGATVERLGVVPTPVVAHVSAAREVPGVVISASHNAYGDNGIKFFAPGGLKLSDAVEEALEAELDRLVADGLVPVGGHGDDQPDDVQTGHEQTDDHGFDAGAGPDPVARDDLARYERAVVASVAGHDLAGLHVVIDCANGSAWSVAPEVLVRLGARVEVIHAEPDGRNINRACGSTHPQELQAAVVAAGAAVGLAFDGDADRVVAVDERGQLVDGDHLLALCALDLRSRGELTDEAVVVTVMTNLGFRLAMADAGIEVVETQVGDRYVLEALEARGLALGGEQSGHVIFRRLATTGDGLLTGVQLLSLVSRAARPLSELAREAMTRLPQVLTSVSVGRIGAGSDAVAAIADDVAAVEARLGTQGRVLVRPSGTEPLVRVMVEAVDPAAAQAGADQLVAALEAQARSAPAHPG
jgi:phosphoglucosamine mutase